MCALLRVRPPQNMLQSETIICRFCHGKTRKNTEIFRAFCVIPWLIRGKIHTMKYPNLDCQLYFLFRTHLWRDGELKEEPFRGRFDRLHENGVKIDEDKRLFRRNFSDIDHWQQRLADAWKNILQCYTDAYAETPSRHAEKKARQFCEMALYGVALFIMDEDIVRHKIDIPLRIDDKQHDLYFALPNPTTELLTVCDSDKQMPEMARFYAFNLANPPTSGNYALKIEGNHPYLAPMQPQQTANNPIFAVYAMQHSSGLERFHPNEISPWVEPFQHFLCVGNHGQPALFVSVLPRLIMRQWQFKRIDNAAKKQRQTLHQYNTLYRNKPDQYLICTNNRELERQLREIEDLRTEADYMAGRLQQAVKTLEINLNNLERHLQATENETRWQVDWQLGSFKPLLDDFSQEINKLHNHQEYLQGEVTYLTGARHRWHAYLEARRLKMSERLNILGHVLVILVILAEIGNISSRNKQADSNFIMQWLDYLSSNAGVYTLTVIAVLFLFFFKPIKNWLKEFIDCRFKK